MLQQTQVSRVVPAWSEFLRRFPTVPSCAAAAPADVVRAWVGLGYNRRALYLHRASEAMVERHGGRVPSELAALTALPGVGSYTARAVRAFAFERDDGVIDTNAARVLARAVAGRPLGQADAQRLADALVPPGRGWAWNQAMLDLGATVCTKRAPACAGCCLHRSGRTAVCAWARAGFGDPDPCRGSAGVSGAQGPFAGSDRQGRGRLLDALRRGPVTETPGAIAEACGWPADHGRAAAVAEALVREGFATRTADGYLALRGAVRPS
jgi:A/G-specific adenine glycosylase